MSAKLTDERLKEISTSKLRKELTKWQKPQHKEGCSVYWVSNSGYPFQCNCGAEVQEPAAPSPDPEILKAARARIEQMACSSGADLEHLPNPGLCLSDRCDKCNLLRFLDAFAQSCNGRIQQEREDYRLSTRDLGIRLVAKQDELRAAESRVRELEGQLEQVCGDVKAAQADYSNEHKLREKAEADLAALKELFAELDNTGAIVCLTPRHEELRKRLL